MSFAGKKDILKNIRKIRVEYINIHEFRPVLYQCSSTKEAERQRKNAEDI